MKCTKNFIAVRKDNFVNVFITRGVFMQVLVGILQM